MLKTIAHIDVVKQVFTSASVYIKAVKELDVQHRLDVCKSPETYLSMYITSCIFVLSNLIPRQNGVFRNVEGHSCEQVHLQRTENIECI